MWDIVSCEEPARLASTGSETRWASRETKEVRKKTRFIKGSKPRVLVPLSKLFTCSIESDIHSLVV